MSALDLLLAAAAVQAVPGGPTPPVPIEPRSWVTAQDYPAKALRGDRKGRVVYELAVDPAGKATGCRILGSSGSKALDGATCPLLLKRARFEPARDPAGRPVAALYRARLTWLLPRRPAAETTLSVLRTDLSPDGLLLRCELEEVVGQDRSDVAITADCGEPLPRPAGEVLRSYAAGYGSLRLYTIFSPVGAPPPGADRSRWGERLSYRVYEFAVGADGRILRCTMTADEGVDPSDKGLCAAEERNLPSDPAVRNGPAAGAIRIEQGIYGTPR